MVNLTWSQIRDPEFNPLMNRLLQQRMANYKTAKRILDLIKDIRDEQKKSDEMWAEIAGKYLEPVEANGQQFMKMKDSLDEAATKEAHEVIQEFYATEATIDRPQLSPFELKDVQLSALDLQKLSGLFDETAQG